MVNKREIRRMKRELEKLIKKVGVDNLSDKLVLEKAIELERAMYEYQSKYRSMLAQNGYAV